LEVTDSGLFHMQCLEMDLREEQPRPHGAEKPDDRPKSAAGPKTEPAILCRACGFVVTTARHRMAV